MTKRCHKCVHWAVEDERDWDVPKGWGNCARAATDDGRPVAADTKMFARDASFYRAGLLTAPDFYCAEFVRAA